MRLVEEKDQFRFFRITHFRQRFEQFGQQPEQKSRIQLRTAHQFIGGEHVDIAAPLIVDLQKIVDLQRRLTKEQIGSLAFETQQLPLDRAHTLLADIAVFARQFFCIFRRIGEHGLQVAKVEQQQTVIIRMAEDNLQHAFLRIVQVEQPREQQGAHFRHRGANRVALFTIQIPENRRIVGIGIVIHAQFRRSALQRFRVFEGGRSGHGYA